MAQLHYGDQEPRRAVADPDLDHFDVNTQGEGYGILGDDKYVSFNTPPPRGSEPPIPPHQQKNDSLTEGNSSFNSPPPRGSEPPIPPHQQRNDPFSEGKPSFFDGFEPFKAKPMDAREDFLPARGYGDAEGKSDVNTQGEGYGVLGDEKDRSFTSPPPGDFGDFEAPIPPHHQRHDPLTADKPSSLVSDGFEFSKVKPDDVGEVFPPAAGSGYVENKQDDSLRGLPASGLRGQPDELSKLKDHDGYTSLGIEESQDSVNSTGVLSDEGSNSLKEREGTAPVHESLAKELEDHPAGGDSITSVPPLKRDFVELSEGETADTRGKKASPQWPSDNAEWQQEDSESGHQGNLRNSLQEVNEREGAPVEALGKNSNEQVERHGGVPSQVTLAVEPEGASSTGSRDIIDVQPPKGDYVATSEAGSKEPNVVDDSSKDDRKNEPKVDDPSNEAGHERTSHFTSQIQSPVDDPKQRYAVDDPIQESVDDTNQDFSIPESTKDFSGLSKEPRKDDPRREDVFLSSRDQEGSPDDVKVKSPVAPIYEDVFAGPIHATDEVGRREAALKAGSLGSAKHQKERGGTFGNIDKQAVKYATPPGTYKGEQVERDGAPPDQSAFAETPEVGFATESRGIADEQPLKEDYVGSSEARGKEQNVADNPIEDDSTTEPVSCESVISEEPGVGSATGSRGDTDRESLKLDYVVPPKADAKEPNSGDGSLEGGNVNEPTPHQAVAVEEPENDSTAKARGIIGGQPLTKEDYVDFSVAKEPDSEGDSTAKSRGINDGQSLKEEYIDLPEPKEPIPANDFTEDSISSEPTPHSLEEPEEPGSDYTAASKGILDEQSLKEDYADLPVAKERNSASDSTGDSTTTGSIPHSSVVAEEPEGSATGSRGLLDVQSLKDNYVNLSDTSIKERNVDGPLQSDSQSAVAEEPEGGSLDGSRGIIDVPSLKEDYVDLSEAKSNNELEVNDLIPDLKKDDVKRTSPGESIVDDHEQENASEVAKPESPIDDAKQSKQPQVTDADKHGGGHFQSDDGKESVKAEGYNIYSGEPESRVYDAVNVIGEDHHDKPRETEENVASPIGEALPESPRVKVVDVPEKASGPDIEDNKQATDIDTSKDREEYEKPFTQYVNLPRKQDAGFKGDAKDVDAQAANKEENTARVPAPEFSVNEGEPEDSDKAAQPERSLDETKQTEAQAPRFPTDNAYGREFLPDEDGKENSKAEGYNVYSDEPKATNYDAADVIGDEHKESRQRAEADVTAKPWKEAKGEALPEAIDSTEEPKNASDIQGDEQAGAFGTLEEHDEHREPFTEHVRSAAVEQDAGFKLDDSDVDSSDVNTGKEAEDVPFGKKSLVFPAADLEQDKLAEVAAKPETALDDSNQSREAGPFSTSENKDGPEHFQGVDGREKIKAEGYNIYSGEPEKTVYDVADLIDGEHGNQPREFAEAEADAAVKPVGSGESKVEPAAQHVSPALGQDVAGFIPGGRGVDSDDAKVREKVVADKESPFTDAFKIDSSGTQQGLGFEPDLKDVDESPAVINKKVDATDKERRDNEPAGEEFPNTEFALIDDYVKVGRDGESHVPRQNEESNRDLRGVSERVDQGEERRPTDEHPLDKLSKRGQKDSGEFASPGDVREPEEGQYSARPEGVVPGPGEEMHGIETPRRPPVLPHPQREDVSKPVPESKGHDIGDDERHHHEAGPQKKGLFEKIKEKITPPYNSH